MVEVAEGMDAARAAEACTNALKLLQQEMEKMVSSKTQEDLSTLD